jgi:hypothetical protein
VEVGPRAEQTGSPRGGDGSSDVGASAGSRGAAPRPAVAFASVLAGLAREVDVGEGRVHGALRVTSAGGDLGPGELIALQAGVFRYSEVVDLSSRLIDHATSGLKTVLQSQ